MSTSEPAPGSRQTQPLEVTAYQLASRYLGIAELPGAADSPWIRAWLMAVGIDGSDAADDIPWCAAFVNHIAWLLDLPRPAHNPAAARRWLTVGRPLDVEEAAIGFDVVILARGGGHQPGPDVLDAAGHVGFFAGRADMLGTPGVFVLGGNQADAVSTSRFLMPRVLGIRRLRG